MAHTHAEVEAEFEQQVRVLRRRYLRSLLRMIETRFRAGYFPGKNREEVEQLITIQCEAPQPLATR